MNFYASLSRFMWIVALLVSPVTVVLSQSPPPRKIAYTFGGGAASSTIAVINEDGSGQLQLTDGGFSDAFPSWSPDGSQIVFQSDRFARRTNILRMNADGTGIVPLTDFAQPSSSFDPSWSPDGTKILFVSDRGGSGRAEIWVMNADGTNPIRLTTNVQLSPNFFSSDFEPTWSPDGSKIAFRSNRDGINNPEIYSMNADGSNQVRLTNNTAEDKEPSWSPDGQQIAFFSRGGGRDGIYVIDPSGGNDHNLTPSGFQPNWSPDGAKIVFTDFNPQANFAFTLYVMNSDGSNRTQLTNNGTIDSAAGAWQLTGGPAPPPPPGPPVYSVSGQVFDTSISPNGSGVGGITMTVTGSASATTVTDANGAFLIGNLPQNGNFTLTPSSPNWRFFPTVVTFSTSSPFSGFEGRNFNARFDATPVTVDFISADYDAREGGLATINVERNGDITRTSTIDYATSNGTAIAGTDYVATSGTLRFNPGEGQKSFTIPITYDKLPESSETINLSLSNPTGSIARGRQTAVLTISDPPPQVMRLDNSSQASALNADTWVRDPFSLTTSSFLGQNAPTRIALFARFVDLLPTEDFSAVTVQGFNSQGQIVQLPVEFVGPVPSVAHLDSVTQINVRLPGNLPSGELAISITLRGLTGDLTSIHIR